MLKMEQVAPLPISPNSQPASGNWGEAIIENLIQFAGISTIFIVALIFFFLLREGLPAFFKIPVQTLFGTRWYPIENLFGLLPLLVGSLLVTVGAVAISVPLGLTTAVYLGEIAPPWQHEILKPLIEMLAGIPSIVLGFLGWALLAPIIQHAGAATGLTAFTGSVILAYMSLPTIISISEDALYAVPKEYRDGALAIGATQWQTIWHRGVARCSLWHCDRHYAGHWTRDWRNNGRAHGDGECSEYTCLWPWHVLSTSAHDDGHDCRRDGRSVQWQFALQHAFCHRHLALCHYLCRQFAGRSSRGRPRQTSPE